MQTLNACFYSPVSLGGLRYAELLEQKLTDIKTRYNFFAGLAVPY